MGSNYPIAKGDDQCNCPMDPVNGVLQPMLEPAMIDASTQAALTARCEPMGDPTGQATDRDWDDM